MELAFPTHLIEKIDQKLNEILISRPGTLQHALFEAARYSTLGAGKRLRPILVLIIAESYGSNSETAILPACALELIHTYSLIHDDLPCMDNDDFRRGKPSLHKAYSEGHAVLTGDFLLTYAFQILAEAPNLTLEQRLDLISILSRAAGAEGMVGGQFVDIQFTGKTIDKDALEFVHLNKTAALIATAFQFGGIVGMAPKIDLNHLQQAGLDFGCAFQIADDIADASDTGEENRVSCVNTLGIEEAKVDMKKKLIDAQKHLKRLSVNIDPLILAINSASKVY